MHTPVVEDRFVPYQTKSCHAAAPLRSARTRFAFRVRRRFDLAIERKPLLSLSGHRVDEPILGLRLGEQPMHPGLRVDRQVELFDERPVPRILRRDRRGEERTPPRTTRPASIPVCGSASSGILSVPIGSSTAPFLWRAIRRDSPAPRLGASSFRARSILPASARSISACICSSVMVSPLATVNSRFSRIVRNPSSSASTVILMGISRRSAPGVRPGFSAPIRSCSGPLAPASSSSRAYSSSVTLRANRFGAQRSASHQSSPYSRLSPSHARSPPAAPTPCGTAPAQPSTPRSENPNVIPFLCERNQNSLPPFGSRTYP